jgi:hypothetical protein
MAEDKIEGRELTWRQLLPWTELFRGFQVALDLNKLLLAAAGILVMAFGWWLLAVCFAANFDRPPSWPEKYLTLAQNDKQKAWEMFKRDRDRWNLMHETAGAGKDPFEVYEVADLASSPQEYDEVTAALARSDNNIHAAIENVQRDKKIALTPEKVRIYETWYGKAKRYAVLATWPWYENRGPNPYMLVTGQAGIPWEAGHFWDWFVRDQLLVMIEPLVKFVQPIIYFFSPRSTAYTSFYFLCVLLWTLATWAFFGGAITRIAAVQVARGEKIGLREAVRFTTKRILGYLMAPLFPLLFVFFLLILMVLFGLIHMIPVFGDVVWDGLLWPVMLVFGLVMAVTLVGLVGWPLMSATISTEGTDSWEAVSRSYSYVYQKPWHYIWYCMVGIAYGAVLVFFIGFMGSLTVYLSKWGVSQTPFVAKADREPAFLFVYAPTSFKWRSLLLDGTTVNGQNLVDHGEINETAWNEYVASMSWWNKTGAALVTLWLWLIFLLMLGFGYSYFWGASTIIYLLMRRNVDAAELDEVYLEEEEPEGPYSGHFTPPAPSSSAVKPSAPLTMVEAPTLRPPTPPAPAPSASAPPPPTPVAPPPVAPLPSPSVPPVVPETAKVPDPAPSKPISAPPIPLAPEPPRDKDGDTPT